MLDRSLWNRLLEAEKSSGRLGRVEIEKQFGVSQGQARSLKFALVNRAIISPEIDINPSVKGTSILTKDGEEILRWTKTDRSTDYDSLTTFLEQRIPSNPIKVQAVTGNEDLMLEINIFDLHLGLLAWKHETGASYDSDIARQYALAAIKIILQHAGQVKRITLNFGGDDIHTDNDQHVTAKSHHSLDVDSRLQKIAWVSYELFATIIEQAMANTEEVHVNFAPGNHNNHSSMWMAITMHAYFRNIESVIINRSPAKHKFYRWGTTFFMLTHGDTGGNRLAPYMMNHLIQNDITGIKRMLVRKGHLHKHGRTCPPGLSDENGVKVETFPTLAAPDAYAAAEAYVSGRAAIAYLFHKEYGVRGMVEVGVKEIVDTIRGE